MTKHMRRSNTKQHALAQPMLVVPSAIDRSIDVFINPKIREPRSFACMCSIVRANGVVDGAAGTILTLVAGDVGTAP